MLRAFLRRHLPAPEHVHQHRWLRHLGHRLTQPCLWHLNRRSVARAVGIGLFAGLIPGPLQMLGAALLCIWRKGNLPLALLCTLYTNPLTIGPLYWLAYRLGRWVHPDAPEAAISTQVAGQDWQWLQPASWLPWLGAWLEQQGPALLLGLPLLALLLGLSGYALARLFWSARVRWHIWQRRRSKATVSAHN